MPIVIILWLIILPILLVLGIAHGILSWVAISSLGLVILIPGVLLAYLE